MNLQQRIDTRTARIGVVGLGYVGLPLAVAFAQAGFPVVGVDVDERKVTAIRAGCSPMLTVPDKVVASSVKSGHLHVTTAPRDAGSVDAFIICVPTQLNPDGSPNTHDVVTAVRDVAQQIAAQTLVVVQSSMYPGGTRDVILPILNQSLRAGRDFHLAFSPERTDPGNSIYTLRNIPKLVAGLSPTCVELACDLFRHVVEVVVPVESLEIAEMTKMMENAFRFVNISFMNEMTILCDQLGLDVWQVIEAASTKPFGFLPHYPGPGIGGSCIPVLPNYLQWVASREGTASTLIAAADRINQQMPSFVVARVGGLLHGLEKTLAGSRVLLVGVSYKPNVPDIRNAPSLQIIVQLREQGADVRYHDPLVPSINPDGHKMTSVKLDCLAEYDLITLITPHDVLDYDTLVSSPAPILDTRNKLARFNGRNVVRL